MRDMAAAMTTLISFESQNLKIVFYYILQLEGDNSQKQNIIVVQVDTLIFHYCIQRKVLRLGYQNM